MANLLWFDTETFSEVNLLQAGSAKYARDPSTECLMVTWCVGEGPVLYIDVTKQPIPFELHMMLTDPKYLKIAHNMAFDKDILEFTQGIKIPIEQCMDSQALAYSMGFTGTLGAIQDAIGFSEDVSKIKEGKKLILKFCKPTPKSHKVRRWTRENAPDEWSRFADYAIRDTESMRAMWLWLMKYSPMSEYEWGAWRDTWRMNARGMPIDMGLVEQAIKMAALRKGELKQRLIELTGLENPNSGAQLLPWLDMQGVKLENLQAATVDSALSGGLLGTLCQEVLQLKRTIGQTAVTKWNSIQKMEHEGVVRGQFLYRGASRTGRDASRGINLQNLRRPPKGVMDQLITLVYRGDNQLIDLIHGEPLDFLARTVRGAITAPAGKLLAVSDLSSIESRLLGWLCGCLRMNRIFEEGKDTYKDYATELFGIAYDAVTKDQRTFSKPPVLGSGYMMGGKGLSDYAEGMGVPMTVDEGQHAVSVFREAYPEIPAFWRWIMDALEYVLLNRQPVKGYRLLLYVEGDFLFITLPSGRNISYYQPLWQMWSTPIGDKMSFTYMGINRFKSAPTWERIAAHAGGVTENIVQAIARDVLIEWVRRCRDLHIVGRVHDEVLAVVAEDIAGPALKFINEQAAIPMPWAQDLLLSAEGFVTKHYTKD